jgi:hypothetical protein
MANTISTPGALIAARTLETLLETFPVLRLITADFSPEPAKFGHREKFGNSPEKHKDFSAVTHIAKDKGIPPFLVLHVSNHPDNSAQAFRLGAVLKAADIPVKVFGAKDTDHTKINANLGTAGDPSTAELLGFIQRVMKK